MTDSIPMLTSIDEAQTLAFNKKMEKAKADVNAARSHPMMIEQSFDDTPATDIPTLTSIDTAETIAFRNLMEQPQVNKIKVAADRSKTVADTTIPRSERMRRVIEATKPKPEQRYNDTGAHDIDVMDGVAPPAAEEDWIHARCRDLIDNLCRELILDKPERLINTKLMRELARHLDRMNVQ